MSLSVPSRNNSNDSSNPGEQPIRCRKCELANIARNIKIDGEGPVPARIMIVGQNPGFQEDHKGKNFIGPAGAILNRTLETIGLDRSQCRIVNAIRCFHGRGQNKIKLTDVHIKACRDYLIEEIWAVSPEFIIATGEFALHSLLDKKVKISKYIETIQFETISGRNTPVIPVIHPAALLHGGGDRQEMGGERIRYKKSWEMVGKHLDGLAYDMSDLGTYIHVDTPEQIEECVRMVWETKAFAFDFETGVPPITSEEKELEGKDDRRALRVWTQKDIFMKCVGISPRPRLTYVIDIRKPGTPKEIVNRLLLPIFVSKEILKIAHNIKFDLACGERFFNFEYPITEIPMFDPMNSHFLIAEEESHALTSLTWKYSKIGGYDRKVKEIGGDIGAAHPDVEGVDLYDYNGGDTDMCHRLTPIFLKLMERDRMTSVYKKLVKPSIPSLYRMEKKGVLVDKKLLYRYDLQITGELMAVDKRLQSYQPVKAYLEANPKKDWGPRKKYMATILFDKAYFDYPVINRTKKKKDPAVDGETLETLILKHNSEFARDLLMWQDLAGLQKKNIRKILYLLGLDGRLHTTYAMHIARTGRTSSENPNLQNIPQPYLKEHLHNIFARFNVRRAFIPDPGYEWGSVDYSQHELRILAAISKCPILSQVFINKEDLHRITAAASFEVSPEEVTKELRRYAKTINFGISYLETAFGLARDLNLIQWRKPPEERHFFSEKDTQALTDKWFNKYYGVKEYVRRTAEFIKKNNYIITPTGRKRRFSFINDKILRIAVNTPIQGTASDLLIIALNRIWEAIDKYHFKTFPVLETHDSIDFCIWPPEKEQLKECVSEIMINPPVDFLGDVPLAVDWSFGPNMAECQ